MRACPRTHAGAHTYTQEDLNAPIPEFGPDGKKLTKKEVRRLEKERDAKKREFAELKQREQARTPCPRLRTHTWLHTHELSLELVGPQNHTLVLTKSCICQPLTLAENTHT